MFLNIWSKSRPEDGVQNKLHTKPPGSPRLPVNHAVPSTHKLKRKRDDASSVLSQLDAPSMKPRVETMSHVEISRNDPQRAAPSPIFFQAPARAPVIPVQPTSQTNLTQQVDTFEQASGESRTVPGNPAPKMDSEHQTEGESSNQNILIPAGTDFALLRDTVESQFNLEILLKHRELQLIDQEIAKCQVGLEQLRRCRIIPYPAVSPDITNMQAVSEGSGTVYHNSAPHAPAWGVTDGPYTQHYARWLLQDSEFDDTISNEHMLSPRNQATGDRTTRGVRQERQSVSAESRSSRVSNTSRLTALPDGYPVVKEEKGPCIVTRASDKKRVKLVCIEPTCRRSDFNSAQGFINHCRIQHQRHFTSHDAAINQCGEEIDEGAEVGNSETGGPPTPAAVGIVHPLVRVAFSHAGLPAASPTLPTPSSRTTTTTTVPMNASSLSGVLPMSAQSITTNSPTRPVNIPGNMDGNGDPRQPLKASQETSTQPKSSSQPSKKRKALPTPKGGPSEEEETNLSAERNINRTSTQLPNTPDNIDGKEGPKQPLKTSNSTPYLSKLMARMGKGGDLDDMVKQATTKAEEEELSDEEDEDDTEQEAVQSQPMVKIHSTHGGMRPSAPAPIDTTDAQQHPMGMDGTSETPDTANYLHHQTEYPSPYSMRLESSTSQADTPMLDINTPFNLSPNSTDPHPAPSLVSDDGEGDFENMQSDSESPSDMGDAHDTQHEPQVMDHDGMDLGESSSLNIGGHAKQHHHHNEHHGPPPEITAVTRRSRVASASSTVPHTNEERHIGFQAPAKKANKGSKAKKLR